MTDLILPERIASILFGLFLVLNLVASIFSYFGYRGWFRHRRGYTDQVREAYTDIPCAAFVSMFGVVSWIVAYVITGHFKHGFIFLWENKKHE